MHIGLDHYFLTLRGVLPREILFEQAHRHLMEVCSTCRREWDGRHSFISSEGVGEEGMNADDLMSRHPPAERDFSLSHYDAEVARQSRMRVVARRAREDVAQLHRLPVSEWLTTVRKAKTRFRSRAFALLLLEECRAVVRSSPNEAAALAALVPPALERAAKRAGQPWVRVLIARAEAYRANALRVAGDLPAAERAFDDLRRRLVDSPLADSEADIELDSLEASLRIDQRRFDDADRLLSAAAARAPEHLLPRIVIKHANLWMTLGRVEEALDQFEGAARALDAATEPVLHLATVTGRIDCLCDLGRATEAATLLRAERSAYLDAGDEHLAVLYDFYRARVALSLDRHADAEAGFTAVRDRLLALDRDYDAVIASLYLADTLLAAGKMAELRDLATNLVPLFRSRRVERETLASLRLLAEAVKAETFDTAILDTLRRELERRVGPSVAG